MQAGYFQLLGCPPLIVPCQPYLRFLLQVISERKFLKELANIDPEHLKAARKFPKIHVKDVDATSLEVFKILRESPVDGHKDVTLREVRMTLKTLAEIQEEE